jgi:nucleotide-binding universal stress UspA family protein
MGSSERESLGPPMFASRAQAGLRQIKSEALRLRILMACSLHSGRSVMYQRILVPVDGSPTSVRGLDEAIRIARLTQGQLRLLHVIDELSFALSMDAYAGYAGDWLDSLRAQGRTLLEGCKATAQAAGVEADMALRDTFTGSVHEQVTVEADSWPADLIVLGTHGRRGVGRFVMGSSAENILRYASVPVLLVRAPASESKAKSEPAAGAARLNLPSAALSFE